MSAKERKLTEKQIWVLQIAMCRSDVSKSEAAIAWRLFHRGYLNFESALPNFRLTTKGIEALTALGLYLPFEVQAKLSGRWVRYGRYGTVEKADSTIAWLREHSELNYSDYRVLDENGNPVVRTEPMPARLVEAIARAEKLVGGAA